MAFRATNIIPYQGIREAKTLAINLKSFVSGRSSELSTGGGSGLVLDTLGSLVAYKARFDELSQIPNIGQFAKDQENDQNYDIGVEFSALLANIDSAIQSIISNFPKDDSGFLLAKTLSVDGEQIDRVFTAPQLATTRSDLDAIAASIS